MASYNRVILAGNLTRDPELRYTSKGTAIARLGLALNRSFTTEAGEKREEVTFVDVDAFGRQAEVLGQYMKKGRQVLIEGRLRLDQWEDKNSGQKQSKLRVVLESFTFVDSGRNESHMDANAGANASGGRPAQSAPPPPTTPPPPRPAPPVEQAPPPEEDDVPF